MLRTPYVYRCHEQTEKIPLYFLKNIERFDGLRHMAETKHVNREGQELCTRSLEQRMSSLFFESKMNSVKEKIWARPDGDGTANVWIWILRAAWWNLGYLRNQRQWEPCANNTHMHTWWFVSCPTTHQWMEAEEPGGRIWSRRRRGGRRRRPVEKPNLSKREPDMVAFCFVSFKNKSKIQFCGRIPPWTRAQEQDPTKEWNYGGIRGQV